MSIKNIIFDIGRVLLHFDKPEFLRTFGFEGEELEKVNRAIFLNPAWDDYDRGLYETDELLRQYLSKCAPSLEKEIRKVLCDGWFFDMMSPIDETVKLFWELKKRYSVYLLSNFPKEPYERCEKAFDFLSGADGKVISYEIGLIKPDEGIYQILIEKYGLRPEECVFMDDTKENIETARKLGFNGFVFSNADDARKQLENYGIIL
ncbi:MAG: HAD family phosphatase [Bacillota bacterium]|nr:HAD family phosphatase [Bacillota bacterium]